MTELFCFLAGFIAAAILAKLADGGPCERLRARLFGGGRSQILADGGPGEEPPKGQ